MRNILTSIKSYDIVNSLVGKADFLCLTSPLVCEERLTVNPTNRRIRAFLLEGDMVIRICPTCHLEFLEYPSQIRKFCSKICWNKSRIGSIPWNKGKKGVVHLDLSKKELERRHKQLSGKNNPNWKDGRCKEKGAEYQLVLSRSHWRKNRKVALFRNDYTCQQCKKKDVTLVIHHIIPYKICKTHDINNLVTLCRSCHNKIERHGYKCVF